MKKTITLLMSIAMVLAVMVPVFADGVVKVGLNYPKTGPYSRKSTLPAESWANKFK